MSYNSEPSGQQILICSCRACERNVSVKISAQRSHLFLWPLLSAPLPLNGILPRLLTFQALRQCSLIFGSLRSLRSVFSSAYMVYLTNFNNQ